MCGVPISPPQPPDISSTEVRLKQLSNDTLIGTRKYQVLAPLLGDSGMKVRSRLYAHKPTLQSHCRFVRAVNILALGVKPMLGLVDTEKNQT